MTKVIVTGGLRDSLPLLWRLLKLRGAKRVGVEEPGWWRISRSVTEAGLTPVPIPTDDEGLDLRHQRADEVVGHVGVHVDALGRDARLTGVAEARDGDLLRRRLPITVRLDDDGRHHPDSPTSANSTVALSGSGQ